MLELASLGAKVLQNRSVEMAKKLNVNLVSRSSFTPEVEGTLITKEENTIYFIYQEMDGQLRLTENWEVE